jgi:hypothetical protein
VLRDADGPVHYIYCIIVTLRKGENAGVSLQRLKILAFYPELVFLITLFIRAPNKPAFLFLFLFFFLCSKQYNLELWNFVFV